MTLPRRSDIGRQIDRHLKVVRACLWVISACVVVDIVVVSLKLAGAFG